MPHKSDRIQQEVDELLANIEKFPPPRPLRRRISDIISAPFRAVSRRLSGFSRPNISAGHVLLAAIVIIVVAWLSGFSSNFWMGVGLAGVGLFIAAFVMSLRRQSKPPAKRYWRDQPLDLDDRGSEGSFWDRWRGR
jgi:hypothetical protein